MDLMIEDAARHFKGIPRRGLDLYFASRPVIMEGMGDGEEPMGAGIPERACLRCGDCCRIKGFVRVSAGEIDRMASFLAVDPRDFVERYTRLSANRRGLELEERENGECIFLLGNECGVHSVKPAQCRGFPGVWRFPGVEEICPAWRREP
jgi:Fe-S-cluster containining protein